VLPGVNLKNRTLTDYARPNRLPLNALLPPVASRGSASFLLWHGPNKACKQLVFDCQPMAFIVVFLNLWVSRFTNGGVPRRTKLLSGSAFYSDWVNDRDRLRQLA
jgi:hypothetical protein